MRPGIEPGKEEEDDGRAGGGGGGRMRRRRMMRRMRRRRRGRWRRTWRDMYMEYVLFSDSPAIMNVNRLTNFIHIKWIFVIANIINRDKSFIYYCGFPSLLDPL